MLDPIEYFLLGLSQILASSTDYDELKWVWQGFRDKVGRTNKPHYMRYVELANEIAKANGMYYRTNCL